MEKALEKAIEVGYKMPHVETPDELPAAIRFYTSGKEWTKITSDPQFWQCLGKALGWGQYGWEVKDGPRLNGAYSRPYIHHWHSFIDHLIEGKDLDSFFNGLLK